MWQRLISANVPRGALAASVLALLLLPSLSAPDDPVPSEEDLLSLPGPNADELPEGTDPSQILTSIPDSLQITGTYSISYDQGQGVIHYRGDIQVRADNGLQLFANNAFFDEKNKFVRVTGDVSIYQGAILHRGDSAIYYYEDDILDAEGLRSGMDPILLEAGKFRVEERDGRQVMIGEHAGITTDDTDDPSFWIRADKTTVFPNDRVVFRNLKFYAGDTPILWLPYLSQPLDEELGYHVVPGAKSTWGPFLLNRYGIMLGGESHPETAERRDAWLLSQWHLDLLSKRGVGTGVDFIDTRVNDNPNLGWLKLYYLNDQDPTLKRTDERRTGVDEHRFRAQLRNRLELKDLIPGGNTYLDTDLTLLSDRYYLEDFDRSTFKVEPNPDNIIALTHERGRNLFTFWGRVRPNNFYQSDTRLPELVLDQTRHPLFGSPILHEGQIMFGFYREELGTVERRRLQDEAATLLPGDPRLAEIQFLLSDRGFTRFHVWQEVSAPLVLDGWLNLVPRAGVGYTNYAAVDGPGSAVDNTHIFAGIDASLKFSKEFPDVHSDSLGLDGLLHVLQPYASASWLATDELDSSFGKIDRLTASTRPRPLGVGRFNAIDDLRDWTVVRLGARNRLLTRRDGTSHEWLTLNSYFDWFLVDPEFNREFSNLYNELHFYPLPWLEIGLETQFPLLDKKGEFTEVAASLRYMPCDNLEIILRHRFLDGHPILQDSARLEYEAYGRFNENWGAGFAHRWEFADGVLERQEYSLHRTMDNWAISLGVFHRDNRLEDEFGFILGFTLKEFPSVNLPFKLDTE